MKKNSSVTLLFELGVEEIPSAYFAEAKSTAQSHSLKLLQECGMKAEVEVLITPRRIVIHAKAERDNESVLETRLGPSRDQSYQNASPTVALIGFLKNVGKTEKEIEWISTLKGERASVQLKREVKPLRYFFETIPFKISFPKLMRWDKTNQKFVRPIRWTFAFIGNKMQKFKIADVASGNYTYGHRFLSPKKITIKNSDLKSFEKNLSTHHVVLRPEERLKKIKGFLKGSNNSNDDLIATVANLVEEPFPIKGAFDKKYLKLPAAVLATCMSKNQKTFACYDSSEKPKNQFIAIINGPRKNVKQIARNHESVLRSRLEDAEFFFHEDQKTKLETKVEKLKGMIFLGSLGTYFDKTKRVEALVKHLGKMMNLSEEVIRRGTKAAHLAKADLVSHLVYEFPELQGIAGSEYARLDQEGEEISRAISGHYLPANLSEDYRDLKKRLNMEGALVGLCDRIDLLVGATGLGIELSGSQDPYALRRAAGSVVKILRAYPFEFSLLKLLQTSCEQFGNLISRSKDEIIQKLILFFKERIIFELQLKAGSKPYEIIQGIFASGFDSITEIYRKFENLTLTLNDDSFVKACKVMERTGNILKGIKGKIDDRVEPSLLQEKLEQDLYRLYSEEESSLNKLVDDKKYGAAVARYGAIFYQPVHDFFDHVMVNVEDPKIRTNRQALVKKINLLCHAQIADLSLVTNT